MAAIVELTAGGMCADGGVSDEVNDTFGCASEGLGAAEVDVALIVLVVVVKLDVNATLANGFGLEGCESCL